MIRIPLTVLICLLPLFSLAQDQVGFPFGKITYRDLDAKTYPADTSAAAYVISEYGEAHFDYDRPDEVVFTYHVKIKLLKQSSLDMADVEVVLWKGRDSEETLTRLSASAFNNEHSRINETKLDSKALFIEKNKRSYNVAKFAIPNVKPGTVIEYQYQITSPFRQNFRPWEFQSDIPKVYSEYKTTIPANYTYNITLRGYLELGSHESSLVRDCLRAGNGGSADCSVNTYIMKDIPAFKDEEFMTARTNFLSAIRFELSEIKTFDGRTVKYTKEWKDADQELKTSSDFGLQLKRGKDVVDGYIDVATLGESDPLKKAKKIHEFVKYHYIWNEFYGDRSDLGIKKAFDEKKGNVGDINLTLIAALRYAGFKVDPVLIATRHLSRPVEIHPVLSDFNYVIAKLDLDGKTYLLDAVDDFLPFGSIPISCYNSIGRVIDSDKGSYWMDIKPTERDRIVTLISLALTEDGKMKGTINESRYGYAAVSRRKEISGFQDDKSYIEKIKSSNPFLNITSYERTSDEDFSKPVSEKFGVEVDAFDPQTAASFLFNPFISGKESSNPFKSDKRAYPVDFAVPKDRTVTIVIEFPASFEVASMPDKVGLALPNSGGRYIFGAQVVANKLSITNNLSVVRTLFAPEEYPYLKEIYGKMLQAQNTDVIFQKKK